MANKNHIGIVRKAVGIKNNIRREAISSYCDGPKVKAEMTTVDKNYRVISV